MERRAVIAAIDRGTGVDREPEDREAVLRDLVAMRMTSAAKSVPRALRRHRGSGSSGDGSSTFPRWRGAPEHRQLPSSCAKGLDQLDYTAGREARSDNEMGEKSA